MKRRTVVPTNVAQVAVVIVLGASVEKEGALINSLEAHWRLEQYDRIATRWKRPSSHILMFKKNLFIIDVYTYPTIQL